MNRIETFLAKVRRFLDRHRLDQADWVLAVSGGPDSVALLRAMVQLRRRALKERDDRPCSRLVVAHLNHMLRGAESEADERFVAELCNELGAREDVVLRFCSRQSDAASLAGSLRANLESTARAIRYAWLAEVAQSHGMEQVATGHTADDQAETVLHNLLRGSGLRGLRGIAPRRKLGPEAVLARPLLEISREEVLAYLSALGQDYRVDRSNADLSFTRNRIRHEVLPYLVEKVNPQIAASLTRLAGQAKAAYEETRVLAAALLTTTELPRAGAQIVFDQARLAAMPRSWLREVFRQVWLREGWPEAGMGFREWDRLAGLALAELSALDLPGGIRARRRQRVVQVGPVS
jgi:tRNA(Ile)-lysidine synthase